MPSIDSIKERILIALLEDFRSKELGADSLKRDYEGVAIRSLHEMLNGEAKVDVYLAFKELEEKKLIGTGPMEAYENKPGSSIMILGVFSKREYAYLKEGGYKIAAAYPASAAKKYKSKASLAAALEKHFYGIHPRIIEKCGSLYENGEYAEAVEKSFKTVRDRLRDLTGYETGSEAFGKGKLYIQGATAPHVDADFNQAVKFLTMAIDMFRNEKSHTSDARIDDPVRAHQYLSLSSLALALLEKATKQG